MPRFTVKKDGDWWKVNSGTIGSRYYKVVRKLNKKEAQGIADARNRLVKKKSRK